MNRGNDRKKTVVDVRTRVAEAYGKLVEKGRGPCGEYAPTSIGYAPEELGDVPHDAVVNAFGCGNPLAYSEVRQGQVVLDLGSGAGIDVILAARKVGPAGRVIGVDMTPEMIARARENIARAGLSNAEIREGYIEALPVEDTSVDWVISNCVISLSPDKPKVFAEIARVLRPGGRFSISDLVVSEMPAWLRELPALHDACIGGALDEAAYLEGLRDAGLIDVRVVARSTYDAEQIRALVASGEVLVPEGISDATISAGIEALAGKVQSIKVVGAKPGA